MRLKRTHNNNNNSATDSATILIAKTVFGSNSLFGWKNQINEEIKIEKNTLK